MDSRPAQLDRSVRRPGGFTLVEMLVVIGIIVLLVVLALPAFNAITGGRSLEVAQNQISAALGVARAEAIGLQQPRGLFFYQDTGTGRVVLTQVYFPAVATTNPPYPLELYGDRQEVTLPVGIAMRSVPDAAGVDLNKWPSFGLIVFDGNGQLVSERWTIKTADSPELLARLKQTNTEAVSAVVSRLDDLSDTEDKSFKTKTSRGTIGFVLYDQTDYAAQTTDADRKTYLQENGLPVLVNRFNGTLRTAE